MSNTSKESKRRNNIWEKSIYKNCTIQKFAEAYIKYEILYMPVISLTHSQLQRRRAAAHEQLAAELGLDVTRAKMSALCYKFRWLFDDAIRKREVEIGHRNTIVPATKQQIRAAGEVPIWTMQVANCLARSGRCGRGRGPSREAEQLASALAERGWRRQTVDPISSATSSLRHVWTSICDMVKRKLWLLRSRGDRLGDANVATVLTSADWRVADLLLMYGDSRAGILVDQESVRLYDQLQPLITLFHLVQEYRVEEPADRNVMARRWSLIYIAYKERGLIASLVTLQRRWFELKSQTRWRVLSYWMNSRAGNELDSTMMPTPLHVSIAKRYPHVVTQPMKSWAEMVKGGDVFPALCFEQMLQSEMIENNEPAAAAAAHSRTHTHTQSEHTDTELDDDLILIEKHIETIEVDDEDGDDYHEESDRLVIDEQPTSATNATNATNEPSEDTRTYFMEQDVKPDFTYTAIVLRNDLKKEPIDSYELMELASRTDAQPDEQPDAQPDAQPDEQLGHSNSNVQDLGIEALVQVDPSKVQATILFESDEDDNEVPAASGDIQTNANNEISVQVPDINKYNFKCPEEVKSVKLKCENKQPNFKSRIKFEDDINTDSREMQSNVTDRTNQRDSHSMSETANDCDRDDDSEISAKGIDEKLLMDAVVQLVKLDDTKSWKMYNRKHYINVRNIDYTEFDLMPVKFVEEVSRKRKAEETLNQQSDSASEDSDYEDEMVFKFLKWKPQGDRNKSRRSTRAARWMNFTETDKKLYGTSNNDIANVVKDENERAETNSGAKRVAKRVELPDIEEVRRINSNILTAQVAPLPADEQQNGAGREPERGGRGAEPPRRAGSAQSDDHQEVGESLPSQRVLHYLLNDLANYERKRQNDARGTRQGPSRGAHCCQARRDRAINDARRRIAERAGRTFAAVSIHKHRGTCSCCCLHLLSSGNSSRLASEVNRLSQDVRNLLRAGHPQYQEILNLMSEVTMDASSDIIETSTKSKDKATKKCSRSKKNTVVTNPQSRKEDFGYAEWIQQRNLCAKYFELRGSAIDKINKPADKQNPVIKTLALAKTPAVAQAPTLVQVRSLAQAPALGPAPALAPAPAAALAQESTLVSTPPLAPEPVVALEPAQALTITPTKALAVTAGRALAPASELTLEPALAPAQQPVLAPAPEPKLAPAPGLAPATELTPAPKLTPTSVMIQPQRHNVFHTAEISSKVTHINNTAEIISKNELWKAQEQMFSIAPKKRPNRETIHRIVDRLNKLSLNEAYHSRPMRRRRNNRGRRFTRASNAPPACLDEPIVIEDDSDSEVALPDQLHITDSNDMATIPVQKEIQQGQITTRRLLIHLPHVGPTTSSTSGVHGLPGAPPILPPVDDRLCPALTAFCRSHLFTDVDFFAKPVTKSTDNGGNSTDDSGAVTAHSVNVDTVSTLDDCTTVITSDIASAGVISTASDITGAGVITTASDITGAGVITTASDIAGTGVITTASEIADAGVITTASEIADAGVITTASDITGADVIYTASDIAGAGVITTASDITGAGVITTASDIAGAGVITTASDIAGAGVITTASNIIGAGVITAASDIAGAGVITTASDIADNGVITTASDIAGAGVITTASDITGAGVITTASDIAGAGVITTASDIAGAGVITTASNIIGAGVITTASDIAGAGVITSASDIADNGVITTASDIADAGVITTASNIADAGVITTASDIDDADVITTASDIACAGVITTASNIADAGVITTASDIADAGVITTASDIADTGVITTASDIADAGVITTASNIADAGVITTASDIDDADVITTASDIADAGVIPTITETTGAGVISTIANIAGTVVSSTASNARAGISSTASHVAMAVAHPDTHFVKEPVPSVQQLRKDPTRPQKSLVRPVKGNLARNVRPVRVKPARTSRSLLKPQNRSNVLLKIEKPYPLPPSDPLEPMGGLVKSADYIEGHDPTSLRILCKDGSKPFWVLAGHYIVLTSSPYEQELSSPQYYTFHPLERAAKLVFPEQPASCRPVLVAPDSLTVSDKCYKKMSETPLRYAQVYYVVGNMYECRRLVLGDKPLHMLCTRTAHTHPLLPRRTDCHKLVGLHCAALRPLEELVYLFNRFPAPQSIVAANPRTDALPKTGTPGASSEGGSLNSRSSRQVQEHVNKRADLVQLVNCLHSNTTQVVEIESEDEA